MVGGSSNGRTIVVLKEDEMRDEKRKLAGIRSRNTAHLLDSYCFRVVAQNGQRAR